MLLEKLQYTLNIMRLKNEYALRAEHIDKSKL